MNSVITKVLHQVHPDTRTSLQAKETLSAMLQSVLTAIVETSPSLSMNTINSAVRNLLPGELAKHALSEAGKALSKYKSSAGPHDMKHVKSMTHLNLSPVTVKKMVKNMEVYAFMKANELDVNDFKDIPVESFIFLAAVIEYLMAEILDIAGNAASDNRKSTIGNWHIELVLLNDEELTELFTRVGNPLAEHWRTPAQYPKMSKYQMRLDLAKLGIKLDGPPFPGRTKTFKMYPDRNEYAKKECKGQNKDPEIYICNPRTGKYIKKNSYAAKFI
jgi:histone H3/H4